MQIAIPSETQASANAVSPQSGDRVASLSEQYWGIHPKPLKERSAPKVADLGDSHQHQSGVRGSRRPCDRSDSGAREHAVAALGEVPLTATRTESNIGTQATLAATDRSIVAWAKLVVTDVDS